MSRIRPLPGLTKQSFGALEQDRRKTLMLRSRHGDRALSCPVFWAGAVAGVRCGAYQVRRSCGDGYGRGQQWSRPLCLAGQRKAADDPAPALTMTRGKKAIVMAELTVVANS